MSTIDALRDMLTSARDQRSERGSSVSAGELRDMWLRAQADAADPQVQAFFRDLPAHQLDSGWRFFRRSAESARTLRGTLLAGLPTPAASGPGRSREPLVPTKRFTDNPEVTTQLSTLAARAQGGGASSMMFLPASGIAYESWAFSYRTGNAKVMNVTAAPADGMMRGTIVINPSGHAGAAELERYAKTNVYNVRVQLPDGRVLQRTAIPRNKPSSSEYATRIDIEFPYIKGVTEISAWPEGSGGAYGYIEGRVYRLHSADAPAARESGAYSDF